MNGFLGSSIRIVAGVAIALGSTAAWAESVPVITAKDLAGQALLDPNGKELGTVRYVLVRVGTGDIRGVAVREEDSEQDGLVFVPSADLEISVVEDEMRTRAAAEQLRKAPHFTSEELARLTEPATFTTVEEYWAPMRVDVASAPPSEAPAAEKETAEEPKSDEPVAHVLVGRTVVTTLADPEVNFAKQVVGADVYSRAGERLGEIDDIVIDASENRVAYAVIVAGGFLGVGSEWYAVPMESLHWTGAEKRLRFEGDVARLKEFKSLDASRAPMRISRSDQVELYERFGIDPYWIQNQDR